MTSRHRHDNKQAMREQAQQQRALQAAQVLERAETTPGASELFQQPIKVHRKNHDFTAELAKNILGDYEQVQPNLSRYSLLGVARAPGTPQPCKTGKSQSSYFTKSSLNGAHKNASYKFGIQAGGQTGESQKAASSVTTSSSGHHSEAKQRDNNDHKSSTTKWSSSSSSSVRKGEHTSKSDRHRTKYEPGSSPDKSVKNREKSGERPDNSRPSTVTPTKSSHGRSSSHKSPSSASSRHKDVKPGKDSSLHEAADLVKRLSPALPVSPINPSPKKGDPDSKNSVSAVISKSPISSQPDDKKMAPPNGTIPVNGLTKKHRQINLPKIRIQPEGKPPIDPSSSVDDIIKEMTRIEAPLTGISTPHKEKNFPFPSGHVVHDSSSLLQVTKQLMDCAPHKGGNGKTQGNILTDLEVSESESEVEDGHKCKDNSNNEVTEDQDARSPEQEVRMSSSESEGSSGSSSESGSESESSGSDGEEEETVPPPKVKVEVEEKVSPVKTPNSSTEPASEQQKPIQSWSLKTFLVPKAATTSIIGSDISLCDTLKDATDTSLGDLTDSLLKSSGKSNELIPEFRADIDLPGNESDIESQSRVRQPKKDHKNTKHKHHSSSSIDTLTNHSHKRGSDTRSPGKSQVKSPVAAVQETRTPTKSQATKKVARKNSTASEKSQKSSSAKCKNGLREEKLSGGSAKSVGKAGTAPKPEGRRRGRPRTKPKTPPVILHSDTSSDDEEGMDVDVVSISPEKKPDIIEKIDFSTPPRNEVSKSIVITSPSRTSLASSSKHGAKRKDSDRKEKKERKKHDKQSEDKRKSKNSPLSDKENSKCSLDVKDIDMCNLGVVMNESNFRILSPIPSVPPKSIAGVNYLDGKPSIVVRLNLSLLDRIPPNMPKDTDLKSPESGISSMSSMSSNTCTTALSHTISGALDSTDSREEDCPPDLTDSLNDSAIEDVGDTPRYPSIKLDSSRSNDAKQDGSKDHCANDTATTPQGNSCVVKESSLGSSVIVPDISEGIISQLWDNKPSQQKRKRKYPKEGSSETKQPKPSPKATKRTESSPIRDLKIKEEKEAESRSPSKTTERRSSSSSNSSHQSHKDKAKRRKCDKDSASEKDKVAKEEVDVKLKNGETDVRQTPSPCSNSHKSVVRSGRINLNQRIQPAGEYLLEATKLKHEADSLGDKKHRPLIYLEAVLSFILSGYAMEQEQISDTTRYFKMYTETLALVKFTNVGRFRNNHHDHDGPNIEKQLAVLSLRIRSLLCLKLFKLKKAETLRLKKVIDDHNKISSKTTPSAPSPHQSSWNSRGTGTPSPMSPTPSPAGSIGSVGSQSSNCDVNPSKLANGNLSTGTVTSPGYVSVPQRIHSITSQYISHTSYLVQAMDMWDQGDNAGAECGDFFERLESQTGALSLHSSMWDLVRYVRQGLVLLKDT